jgi:hypothetical protein
MLILISKICNWRYQPPNQHRTMSEASSSNTSSIVLTPMTQCWLVWRWYQSMVSVQHSMPVPIQTSSKPTSDLSSIIKGHSYIQAISAYEFICCFNFIDQFTYRLSQPPYKFCVNAATPACTSKWLFKQVHTHLVYLWDATVNCLCQTNLPCRQP